MKKLMLSLGLILMLSFLVMGCKQKQAKQKWEYQIMALSDSAFETDINKLGEEGWEMIFARRAMSDGKASYEMIFKRPK